MNSQLKGLLDNFDRGLTVIRSYYMYAEIMPEAKQSTRFRKKGRQLKGKRGISHSYPDPKKKKYQDNLIEQLGRSYNGPERIYGSVRLTILYSFPFSKKQIEEGVMSLVWTLMRSRPDLDNLHKPVADSLLDVCLEDDATVVEVRSRKIRAAWTGVWMKLDEVKPNRLS